MLKRSVLALITAAAILLLGATPAFAHTEFASSNPGDGSVLERPVTLIELVFSGEAEPAGDGFVVRDGAGAIREPDVVESVDRLTWVLSFDQPLPSGETGVRWSVAAPDAHPIEGSFAFTVAAGTAATTTLAPSTTDVPVTSGTSEQVAAIDLDSFLNPQDEHAFLLRPLGIAGRSLSLLGAMLSIGGIVFAGLVLRGTESDIRSVLFWVRRAAVLLAVGAVLELVHQLAAINGDWLTVWPFSTLFGTLWSPFGLSILLRVVGAGLMLRAHLDVVPAAEVTDPVVAVQVAIGIGAGPSPDGNDTTTFHQTDPGEPYLHDGDKAWRVDGELWLVAVGVFAALLSYVFDGHTVTEGIRLLTGLVDIAHVAAAAVWAGGLVMMVHVVWLRHRSGADVRALQLAVRFSVVAAVALVIAGMAGVVLAAIILDSVDELWSTPWGRFLLAKVAIVAAAAAAGGYNHKVLIPRMMNRPPNDPQSDAEFRRAVSIEGAAIGLVVVLTALLVGAAS